MLFVWDQVHALTSGKVVTIVELSTKKDRPICNEVISWGVPPQELRLVRILLLQLPMTLLFHLTKM